MPINSHRIILANANYIFPYPIPTEDDGHEAGSGLVHFFRPMTVIVEFLHQGFDTRWIRHDLASPRYQVRTVNHDAITISTFVIIVTPSTSTITEIWKLLIDGVAPCEPIHSSSNDATAYRSNVLNWTDLWTDFQTFALVTQQLGLRLSMRSLFYTHMLLLGQHTEASASDFDKGGTRQREYPSPPRSIKPVSVSQHVVARAAEKASEEPW